MGLKSSWLKSLGFKLRAQNEDTQQRHKSNRYINEICFHPFILQPQFLQFLEIWFEKSGSINLVQEKWFCKLGFFFWFEKSGWPEKQVGLYYKSTFFQVGEKWFYKLGFFFWFEKSGWPERWVYTINPPFFRLDKSGSENSEKWLTRKKNPSLQNHFSRTTSEWGTKEISSVPLSTLSLWYEVRKY